MTFHILNGDSLADKFPETEIKGQVIVIREAFIEGPLTVEFGSRYWDQRAEFISAAYGADKEQYHQMFLSQLQIMNSVQQGDDVCLWFEDDLFCLANMWFSIYFLSPKDGVRFYRIFPPEDVQHWTGFGKGEAEELLQNFEERILFTDEEINLSNQLWEAYATNDRARLKALSFSDSSCFRFLPRVVQAHLDRHPESGMIGRPQQTLLDILNGGKTNFYEIFEDFWDKEAIYGFGDVQVYNMLHGMGIELSEEM